MLGMVLTLMLVGAQEEAPASVYRADQVRELRETKALHLRKPTRTFVEKALYEFKERRILEQFQEGWYGFRPLLGGMPTGAGFSAGTVFEKGRFRASAQASTKGYQKYEGSYSIPHLIAGRLDGEVRVTHRNLPKETTFGMGMASEAADRSTYHLRDTHYQGRVAYRIKKDVTAGVRVGWLESDIAATNTADHALAHLQSGVFLHFDNRDQPENPRAGGRHTLDWTTFRNGDHPYNFDRYDIETQQYFPFFNQRRVIAVRAHATLTRTASGQNVPFYMMPTLGGADDLRGFEDFRFRDRNKVVLNAEYRWEVFSGLDMALFADAGQVAARLHDFKLNQFKTAGGIGFRFNTAKSVFLRIDLGFSEEGARLFLKFNNVF